MNELCWFRITQSRQKAKWRLLKIWISKLTYFLSWLDLTPLPADLPQAVFLVFQLPAPSPFWSSPLLWRCPRTLDRSPTWATEVPPRNMPCFQYFEQRNRRRPSADRPQVRPRSQGQRWVHGIGARPHLRAGNHPKPGVAIVGCTVSMVQRISKIDLSFSIDQADN